MGFRPIENKYKLMQQSCRKKKEISKEILVKGYSTGGRYSIKISISNTFSLLVVFFFLDIKMISKITDAYIANGDKIIK